MHKSRSTLPALAVQLLLACAVAGVSAETLPQPSPYVGQEARAIKSLSEQDVDDLLAGRGAGLAKVAELNGYPGPAHVLELRDGLKLSEAQFAATQALMAQHRVHAQRLGEEVVRAERSLEKAFRDHTADENSVRKLTSEVARLQGDLRAEHLRTHLAQTALLTPEQVARYAELRGYANPQAGPGLHHQHRH
jgi:Spy/CpxP family protein refolding chaperone